MTKQFCCQVYTSRNWKPTCTQKNLYMKIRSSVTDNSPKVERNEMLNNRWMNKQNMVCPYDGILLSHEKEVWHVLQSWWTLKTLCSMEEANVRDHILYYSVSIKCHGKDWCWSWSFNTLVISCEELTHWKRPWCWERLRAGGWCFWHWVWIFRHGSVRLWPPACNIPHGIHSCTQNAISPAHHHQLQFLIFPFISLNFLIWESCLFVFPEYLWSQLI